MNIKSMRLAAGLTQTQLAQKAGMNYRWIQKLERGEILIENITLKNAIKLFSALENTENLEEIYKIMKNAVDND